MMRVSLHSSSLWEGLRCASTPRNTVLIAPIRRIIRPTTKAFSTSSILHESVTAAPPIQFKSTGHVEERLTEQDNGRLFYARLLPASRSYFTAQPEFMDNFLRLQALADKYASLPTINPADVPRVAWESLANYRNVSGENVKASKYTKIIEVLGRLNRIHPALMPKEVKDAIAVYKRDVNPYENKAKTRTLDKFGRGLGGGRRKTSTARAWLVEGTGEVMINGKTLAEAFARVHDRESVIWALKATHRIDKYNVWALCNGGGTTGQAEALALAVGKALLVHEPALKPAVRRSGCITRDPRRVERKKPGHVKARKMPAWVKR